jgi:hypothetical protein
MHCHVRYRLRRLQELTGPIPVRPRAFPELASAVYGVYLDDGTSPG